MSPRPRIRWPLGPLLALTLGIGCERAGPKIEAASPGEAQAVEAASPGVAEPAAPPIEITLEITQTAVVVTHVEALDEPGDPRRERGPARFEIATILAGERSDEREPFRSELARLHARATGRADPAPEDEDAAEGEDQRLLVRVTDDVGTRKVQEVLDRALRAGPWELTLEVQGPGAPRLVPLLPYAFCACPMPEGTTWCAAPSLRIDEAGVTLLATPDLRPPPGCHKTIPRVGQERPPFAAAIDWRNRVIAGPEGGCPSATIDRRRVDRDALRERLVALHDAAPGCGWAEVAVDGQIPWARVAEVLAALHETFGVLRISFRDPTPTPDRECARALTIDALRPASATGSPLARRPGCREER
jgi:hypothetical protein